MHPESPKHVRAGENESNWSYRTAGTSGTEKATIWATDSLGARSAEAELVVTFGTEVDSPPTCQPNPWFAWEGVANPVLMRLGTPRRFALGCTDADSDPFGVRITSLPAFGEITSLAIGPPSSHTTACTAGWRARTRQRPRASSPTSSR